MNIGYVGQFRSIRLSRLQRRCRHWDRIWIWEPIHVDELLAYVGGVGVLIPKVHVVDK